MKLKINPQIFVQYPDVVLGVLSVHGLNNMENIPELQSQLRVAERTALATIGDESIVEHPHIVPWREAYRLFGAKPKKYPSSIENLIRRISSGEQIRHINTLVDIYNIISLAHILPVGGEDVDKMEGDLQLTIAGENEVPIKLLGEPEERPPYPNEVIYKDDIGTICRRWNWKEADRTKLTEETKNAVLVIEGLPPVGKEQVTIALDKLRELIEKFCGGEIRSFILDKSQTEVDL